MTSHGNKLGRELANILVDIVGLLSRHPIPLSNWTDSHSYYFLHYLMEWHLIPKAHSKLICHLLWLTLCSSNGNKHWLAIGDGFPKFMSKHCYSIHENLKITPYAQTDKFKIYLTEATQHGPSVHRTSTDTSKPRNYYMNRTASGIMTVKGPIHVNKDNNNNIIVIDWSLYFVKDAFKLCRIVFIITLSSSNRNYDLLVRVVIALSITLECVVSFTWYCLQ